MFADQSFRHQPDNSIATCDSDEIGRFVETLLPVGVFGGLVHRRVPGLANKSHQVVARRLLVPPGLGIMN